MSEASAIGGEPPSQSKRDALFGQLYEETDFQAILKIFGDLCGEIGVDTKEYDGFYSAFKRSFTSWKTGALFQLLDARAKQVVYDGQKACAGKNVLVIGGGPVGLRAAIEASFLGAKVDLVEKRTSFTRNNSLHLWPFLITDLKNLGAKKFYGRFCSSTIDHISIRILQSILLRICLILGIKVHSGVTFNKLNEPTTANSSWTVTTTPTSSLAASSHFDIIIGADGKQNCLPGFCSKEFRAKLALAITANYVNSFTKQESSVPEISGVSYVYRQDFFNNLMEKMGIELENIVYYKDETHYFVMTAKKASLLRKGVLKKDYNDPAVLLSKDNLDKKALERYATEAVTYSTEGALGDLPFEKNHRGENDVALFDFTSLFASENAAQVIERKGKKILMCLVGDSLLEPFWPTGTGCARGFLGAFDAAWMMKRFCAGDNILEILDEREAILYLLPQTIPERLQKNHAAYSIDPKTRYMNLSELIPPVDISHLYNTDDSNALQLSRNQSIAKLSTRGKPPVKATEAEAPPGIKKSLSVNTELAFFSKKNIPPDDESVSAQKLAEPEDPEKIKTFWQKKQDLKSSNRKDKTSSGVTKPDPSKIKKSPKTSPKFIRHRSASPASPKPNKDDKTTQSRNKIESPPKWFKFRGKNQRSRSESPERLAKKEHKETNSHSEHPLKIAATADTRGSDVVEESQLNVLDRIKHYNIKDAAVKEQETASKVQPKDLPKSSKEEEKSRDTRNAKVKSKGDKVKNKDEAKGKKKEKDADKDKKKQTKSTDKKESKNWNPFKKSHKAEVTKEAVEKKSKKVKEDDKKNLPKAEEGAQVFGVKNRIEKLKEQGLMTDGIDGEDVMLLSAVKKNEEDLFAGLDEIDHSGEVTVLSDGRREMDHDDNIEVSETEIIEQDEGSGDSGSEIRIPSPEIRLPSPLSDTTEEEKEEPHPDSTVMEQVKKLQLLQRSPTPQKRPRSFTDVNRSKEFDISQLSHQSKPQEAHPLWKARVIQGLNKCLERFRKENEVKVTKTMLEIINAIFSNVEKYPDNDVFRRVRVSSEQFTSKVWQYSYASQFLARSGWVQIDDFIVLPMGTPVDMPKRVIEKHLNIMNQMLWSMQIEIPDSPSTVVKRNKAKSKIRGRVTSCLRRESYATMLVEESIERISEEDHQRAMAAARLRKNSFDDGRRSLSPVSSVDGPLAESKEVEENEVLRHKLEEAQTIKAATAARRMWEARNDESKMRQSLETELYDLPPTKLAESMVEGNYVPSSYRRELSNIEERIRLLSVGSSSSIKVARAKVDNIGLSALDENTVSVFDTIPSTELIAPLEKEKMSPDSASPTPHNEEEMVSNSINTSPIHSTDPVTDESKSGGDTAAESRGGESPVGGPASDSSGESTSKDSSEVNSVGLDRPQSPPLGDQLKALTSASRTNNSEKREGTCPTKSERDQYEKITMEAAALSREKWKQTEEMTTL